MVRRCCVTSCNSSYLLEKEKVTVYRLPSDSEEQQRWAKAISRDNVPIGQKFSSWFSCFEDKRKPSVFENTPKCLIPTPPPPTRPTKKAVSSSRSEVLHDHCVKSVQIRSYFWSVFSCIRTRNNSLFRHFSSSG